MSAGLDSELNEDQKAIAFAVERFCERHCDDAFIKEHVGQFPQEVWQELAAMGVFKPATPEGEDMGGALEVCAIAEALGGKVFPGPVPATFLAAQVLEGHERQQVTDGEALVCLTSKDSQTLLPWGCHADIFLISMRDKIYEASKEGNITPVETLGGEPWGRGQLKQGGELQNAQRGFLLNDIVTAAYLSSAGLRLVREASEYAAVRKQFGKAIGEFQAVAHPLASCAIGLTASQSLARAAASGFDKDCAEGRRLSAETSAYAAGARLSAANAAQQAVFVCHQIFAAIGMTLEGPVFHISRRIRQMISEPPGAGKAEHILLTSIGLGQAS